MTKWTEDQLLAINKDQTNIIVSAGAGSGKTAVLTQRVITKIEKGININNLLVLTFTNAAASEMKDRIRKAIIDKQLYEQLDYIDSSYITTFDSYAQSIVKKYHYILNIPSKVNIVDDTIISIETNNILDDIFEKHYGEENFNNLIKNFSIKDDKKIKNLIISLNKKLDLKSNKKDYLDNYINNYYSNEFIENVLKEYTTSIINIKDEINELYLDINGYMDEKQYEKLSIYLSKLLNSNTYDEIKNSFDDTKFSLRNLDEEAKIIYEKMKENIKQIKSKCIYSENELKENLLSTKDNIEIIITLIRELDERLNKFKLENNSYTFNDIAKMAVKIVKENSEIRNDIKNYFNEIMIDEYQDTNDLQDEFISLIGNNNIYMVGDVKQSIYRFRNANPDIFRKKYNEYSNNLGGIKIDLLKNFRSREEVLNNINTIFNLVMDEDIGNADYKVSHQMVPGNDMYNLKENYKYDMDILTYEKDEEYDEFTNTEIEAFIIAKDIKKKVESNYKIIDKETKELRNVSYGDFCIIMDRGVEFNTYSKIFEYFKIPTVIWQDEKLNVEDDIAILKNIVNLIIKVKEDIIDQEFKYYFTSVSRSFLFNYSDDKILKIFKDNSFKEDELYKLVKEISLNLDDITNNELLDLIIDKFNIYEKTILKGDIDSCMVRYDVFSKLFLSLSNLGYTPYDLKEYFKNSKDLDIKYSLNTKIKTSVNIMNIHKSKGLEFPICYFSGLSKKFFDGEIKTRFLYDNKYGIIIPFNKEGMDDTILKSLYIDKYYNENISEKIRLFYVALTRVKEKMIIVTPKLTKENEINNIVDINTRLKYRSLYDILNSIKNVLNSYNEVVNLETLNLTKDYNFLNNKNNNNDFTKDEKIIIDEISIENNIVKEKRFSKSIKKLYTKDEISNMKYGTYIHYILETLNFNNPNLDIEDTSIKNKIKTFLNNDIFKNINKGKIYKEYEFLFNDKNEVYHGIIDLMVVYDDYIDIIDYKLKNIDDKEYKNQLLGYKKYIQNKLNKKVNLYLYSIYDEILTKVGE